MRWLVIAVVGALCASATPAFAHAMLERASPHVGAVVQAAPTELRLEFSEGVEPAVSRVTLTGPGGEAVKLGPLVTAAGDRRILLAPIVAPLGAGLYHVTWRAVSVDAHVTQGDFQFSVAS